MKEYFVAEGSTKQELMKRVNEMIRDGWIPIGSANASALVGHLGGKYTVWTQGMVKEND